LVILSLLQTKKEFPHQKIKIYSSTVISIVVPVKPANTPKPLLMLLGAEYSDPENWLGA
jgi:hypothetical protein